MESILCLSSPEQVLVDSMCVAEEVSGFRHQLLLCVAAPTCKMLRPSAACIVELAGDMHICYPAAWLLSPKSRLRLAVLHVVYCCCYAPAVRNADEQAGPSKEDNEAAQQVAIDGKKRAADTDRWQGDAKRGRSSV